MRSSRTLPNVVVKPFLGEEPVKQALIDTDILSFFFRAQPRVVQAFETYTAEYPRINISILTYYEILSGLKHSDATSQLGSFSEFVTHCTIVPLTEESVALSKEKHSRVSVQA